MANWLDMASSKRVIVAVVTLFITALASKLGVTIDEDLSKSIGLALAIWITGESASGNPDWLSLLKDPKFLAFAASIATALLGKLGFSPAIANMVLMAVQAVFTAMAMRPPVVPPTPPSQG